MGERGDLFDFKTNKPIFQSDAGVKALQWFAEIARKKALLNASLTMDNNTADADLVSKAIATTIGNTGNWSGYLNQGATFIDAAPFPNFANDASKPGVAYLGDGWNFTIPAKAKNTDAAWAFIDFMQSPEAQLINAKVGQALPVRKSVLSDTYFTTTKQGKQPEVWLKWIANTNHPAPNVPKFTTFYQILNQALQNVVAKGADPGSELQSAAATYQKSL